MAGGRGLYRGVPYVRRVLALLPSTARYCFYFVGGDIGATTWRAVSLFFSIAVNFRKHLTLSYQVVNKTPEYGILEISSNKVPCDILAEYPPNGPVPVDLFFRRALAFLLVNPRVIVHELARLHNACKDAPT